MHRLERLLPALWIPPMPLSGIDVRRLLRWSWVWIAVAGFMANVVVVSSISTASVALPDPPPLQAADPLARSTHIYDRNGRLLAMLHGEEHRIVVDADAMPGHLRDAVIAIEDAAFHEHGGIDLGAVLRAFAANLGEGAVVQGASTITQQYVRNAFDEIGRERTLERKLEEARAALEIEEELSKDEILTRYLNTVYFGRGAYGVEAGARAWFSKPVGKLSLGEAATLAAIIHAPARYLGNPEALRARRDIVIDRMMAEKLVSETWGTSAKGTPLGLRPSDPDSSTRAPSFIEYVRRVLKRPVEEGGFGLTDRDILTGGLHVHTTLDARMQRHAERAVRAVVNRASDPEAALVAMTSRGEIRAMVGSKQVHDLRRARGFNFATQRAPGGGRQAGSSFKPFTLAAYLEDGGDPRDRYRAPSRITIDDERCSTNGDPWRPANYQEQSFGSLDVIGATERSANTVYAQMIAEVGPARAAAMAERLGVTSPLQPVCSIALGTMGVTPLEMARAYATLSARGVRPEVIAVTRIEGPDGAVVAEREPEGRRVLDREVADTVNAILERVIERGTGTPARIGRPAAGKTGTTEEHRDVWFVGHTPHPGLSTAVWMGYPPDDDGRVRPMGRLRGRIVTGGGFAGAIWQRFMQPALRDERVRAFPPADLGRSRIVVSRDDAASDDEPPRDEQRQRRRKKKPRRD